MPTTPNTTTTQQFLDIYDITNDVLILKNGTSAIILTVDAMNFGLLAEEEQDAIMYAYAGLLNSLNYPIQIVVQSKTKDVTGYLRKLTEQEEKTSNETMRKRIAQYRLFVANLIHERNVLDKRFYVVIPATSIEMGFLGAQTFVPGKEDFNISDGFVGAGNSWGSGRESGHPSEQRLARKQGRKINGRKRNFG